jgi:nicotinate-nucleotide--dimethylbenzimidazole phosphoribosyltransferase
VAEVAGLGPNEQALLELAAGVREPDPVWAERAWQRLDSLTKPPRSLGKLEELAAALALAQQTDRPQASPAAVIVMAGDHGVVAEGVTPWPSSVTREMVAGFAAGTAAINQLCERAGARLVVADVGVASDTSALSGVVQANVRRGTRNFAVEPAMTREEAAQAVLVGARIATELAGEGIRLLATGEMGIGNTTPASALVAAYTHVPVTQVVGRGTGADDSMLQRKTRVIEAGLALHQPDAGDPLGTLAALGGLEIAAMAGVYLAGAAAGVPVVTDGLISTAAALAATRLCSACAPYILASHQSEEPGHRVALVALGLDPFLQLRMRLGEGAGAAIALGLFQDACAVMNGMATFAEAGIDDVNA